MPRATVSSNATIRPFDAKLERADAILHARAERLGKKYPRSKGGLSVTSAYAFSEQWSGKLSLEVDATVSPFVHMSSEKAKALIAEILQPVLDDAHEIMKAESLDFPIEVRLQLTQTDSHVMIG